MLPSHDFFDFDEIDNVVDNLEMAAHFLNSSFAFKWKWVCIALHQSLYGLTIASLQGNDSRQTVYDKKKDSGKIIALHAQRVPDSVIAFCFGISEKKVKELIANAWLISFSEALERIQRQEYLSPLENIKPLTISAKEKESIERLSEEFRNEFEHFSPMRWSIKQSEFPDIVEHVLRVIHFIAIEGNYLSISSAQEKRLKTALSKIIEGLNKQVTA